MTRLKGVAAGIVIFVVGSLAIFAVLAALRDEPAAAGPPGVDRGSELVPTGIDYPTVLTRCSHGNRLYVTKWKGSFVAMSVVPSDPSCAK